MPRLDKPGITSFIRRALSSSWRSGRIAASTSWLSLMAICLKLSGFMRRCFRGAWLRWAALRTSCSSGTCAKVGVSSCRASFWRSGLLPMEGRAVHRHEVWALLSSLLLLNGARDHPEVVKITDEHDGCFKKSIWSLFEASVYFSFLSELLAGPSWHVTLSCTKSRWAWWPWTTKATRISISTLLTAMAAKGIKFCGAARALRWVRLAE